MADNPLIDDRLTELLFELAHLDDVCAFPAFAEHDPHTVRAFVDEARRVARTELFPRYRVVDREPPVFEGGSIRVHPEMKHMVRLLKELGIITATRPVDVGGHGLPLCGAAIAYAHLMAGNLSAFSFTGLTTGAAHLIEAFGSDAQKATYMARMYAGEWTGTMALTEPHAGSGLADLTTRATPRDDGRYAIKGSKIFISGGDHDLTENIVHLVLARIDGAPPGTKGISLFAVPKKRLEGGALVDNDVVVSGNLHKIGWKGVPSLALELGSEDRCLGELVGEPHRGLACMFQMMNEARIMVGLHAGATASVAYHEARAYALTRVQGRRLTERDPTTPPIPIIEHDDVKRMLLRQKAIVDASLALSVTTARYADTAAAHPDDEARAHAALVLDLLTPIAKTWPSEAGFESCALAVQVLGGYGYTSEYLPEAFLRDQKLNTLHEGTTGIQALDLLGRKVVAGQGRAMQAFVDDVTRDLAAATRAGVDDALTAPVAAALHDVAALTLELATKGLAGDAAGMLRHARSYLDVMALVVGGWMHASLARAALVRPVASDARAGTLHAARFFVREMLPHAATLAAVIRDDDDSFATMESGWF